MASTSTTFWARCLPCRCRGARRDFLRLDIAVGVGGSLDRIDDHLQSQHGGYSLVDSIASAEPFSIKLERPGIMVRKKVACQMNNNFGDRLTLRCIAQFARPYLGTRQVIWLGRNSRRLSDFLA